jgi:hypothetical protein
MVKQGGEGAHEVISPKALKNATIQYNEDGDPFYNCRTKNE